MERNEKWYDKEGYLDIDIDVFGEGLSLVFMYNFDYPCHYSEIEYTYEGKTETGDISDTRYIYIVSPNKYPKTITKQFGDEEHPYCKKDEKDTMFQQKPLRFIDEAFLLRFTKTKEEKETIRLGEIYNNQFLPNRVTPFSNFEGYMETEYEHFEHDFIREFMTRIFQYKLEHKKPNITMDDMYEILESYGFSRKHEIERLVRVLKNAEIKASSEQQPNVSIGRVLKKADK